VTRRRCCALQRCRAEAKYPKVHEPGPPTDFVVTDAPEFSTEQSDVEKLAEAIRRDPGQPKERVIQAPGVRRARGRALWNNLKGSCGRLSRDRANQGFSFPLAFRRRPRPWTTSATSHRQL
jgi:hypothetical protein